MTPCVRLSLALLVLLAWGADAGAQSIGFDIPRVYGPGPRVPHDAAPFSHRYHYYAGPALYFNGDARQMWYLDYLDRLDRAERLGYPPPRWPAYLSTHPRCCPPPVHFQGQVVVPIGPR